MERIKRRLVLLVSVLFIFGCGDSTSLKPGFDDEPAAKSSSGVSGGKVADVSKIDHEEYMQGSHKGFKCNDCHDKNRNNKKDKDKDGKNDENDHDNDDHDDDRKGDKEKKRHKEKKKHKDHKDRKDRDHSHDSGHLDDCDDEDDEDGSDETGAGDSSDDTEEFVHVEDFGICQNCHSNFSKKHEKSSFSTRCNECHKSGDGNWTTDLRFDYDHTDIGDCVTCHSHKGNENVNDHKGTDCAGCHKYDDWEDTPVEGHSYSDNCAGCHADDRPASHPGGSSVERCESCHSYNGWNKGAHDAVTDCVTCHDEPADMGVTCENCHQYSDGWANPLSGSHENSDNCKGCHLNDRPNTHPSGSSTELCGSCHNFSDNTWNMASHDATTGCMDCHDSPAVSGHNSGAQCESCHTYNDWIMVSVSHSDSMTCEDCHSNDMSHHGGVIKCQSCHQASSLKFTHVSTGDFPLNHRNTNPNDCESCHVSNDFASSGSCIYCHERRNKKVHKTSSNAQCLNCHFR